MTAASGGTTTAVLTTVNTAVTPNTVTQISDSTTTTCNNPVAGTSKTAILDGLCHAVSQSESYIATNGASTLTGSTTAVAVTAFATAVITMIW